MLDIKVSQTTKGLFSLTLLCAVLETSRIFIKNETAYRFLFWNLFLAWIPYILTLLLPSIKPKNKLAIFLVLFCWLLFFPNSPYIITDLLHLKGYTKDILWFDSLLIFTFACTGLLISLNSLQAAHKVFNSLFDKTTSWLLIIGIVFLSGFGIYLGRYCRLNSWDLFNHPIWFFERVVHQFNNPLTFKVTFVYGFVIFYVYLIFNYFYKITDKQILQ
jgi:uncharacterized membrane protein